jgi:hypothetical protein
VLGEQSDDLASVLTSGVGSWRTAFKAVRFSCRPSLTTLHLPIYGYCATLAHSDDSSRTLIGKHGLEILAHGLAGFSQFVTVYQAFSLIENSRPGSMIVIGMLRQLSERLLSQ